MSFNDQDDSHKCTETLKDDEERERWDKNEMEDRLEWEKVFISQLHEFEREKASSDKQKGKTEEVINK